MQSCVRLQESLGANSGKIAAALGDFIAKLLFLGTGAKGEDVVQQTKDDATESQEDGTNDLEDVDPGPGKRLLLVQVGWCLEVFVPH